MLWIVITTSKCNLKCKYCGGSIPDMAEEPLYKMEELRDFISKDKDAIVAFYGGEPLLKDGVVKEMLDILPAKKFVLQTNGFFIKRLEECVHKFDTILISIDGRKEVTDFYRCHGCYDAAMRTLNFLKEKNFEGEIIARMAVSYKTDIYKDVMHLLKFFPYVHWQLDVVWSNLWGLQEFKKWAEESYMPGLKKLINEWMDSIEDKPLGIVQFMGIMTRIFFNSMPIPPCGAGSSAFAITPEGKILACPIAHEFEWNLLGDFKGYKKISIGEPCVSCDYYKICGGRCLFAYKERLWGEEGFKEVCRVTKFLIDELKKYEGKARKFMDKIAYPPYNNTTEIIP